MKTAKPIFATITILFFAIAIWMRIAGFSTHGTIFQYRGGPRASTITSTSVVFFALVFAGFYVFIDMMEKNSIILQFFRKKPDYQQLFDKYLDNDFKAYFDPKSSPSRKDFRNFEKKYSIALPRDFKDFSASPFGGAYIEVKETVWPRPKKYEVGPFWSFFYAFYVYSFSKDCPQWLDIDIQAQEFTTKVNSDYIPFLRVVGNADVYCFDKSGRIVQWDHELEEFNYIDKSFNELLESEMVELRKRKEQKKSHEG